MELRRIWEIIWRRKFIIIQTFGVIFLVAVIGSFLIRKYKPTYQATAKVFVAVSTSNSEFLGNINLKGADRFSSTESVSDNPIDTQIALITCKPIIEKVINKLGLKDKNGKWADPEKLTKSSFITPMFPRRNIAVEQYEETDLLKIVASSGDKKEAMEMANAVANIYVEETKNLSQTELVEINKFVNNELETLHRDYVDALDNLKKFQEVEKTVSLDKEVTTAIEKMTDLNKDRETTLITLKETKVKFNTAKAQMQKEVATDISANVVTVNPQIESLKKELTEQQLLLASLRAELTEEHPEVVRSIKQIAELKEELAKELAVHRQLSPEIKAFEQDIASGQTRLKEIDALIAEYDRLLLNLPAKQYKLATLQLAVDATHEIYTAVMHYKYELDIASAISFCNVRIAEPAELPEKPSKPNIVIIGVLAVFLGMMAGFGAGFLVEYVDDTVKNASDVKERLNLPLLGVVPRLPKKTDLILLERDTPVHLPDIFWRISHSIKMASVDKEIKSLMVTSALPGEGKTIIASNLGITFAQHGRNVLLVDANFFKPGIGSLFKVTGKPGLAEILTEESMLEKTLRSTGIKGLTLLTCGERPSNAGKLLESEKMKNLVDTLADKFDIVIYDTAPVFAVTDTVVLASAIQNSLLVVEAQKTGCRTITQAQESLKNVKNNVLGVVLNKIRLFTLCSILLLLTGCASVPRKSVLSNVPEEEKEASINNVKLTQFIIGPGDEIAITVWRHDDLTRDVKVGSSGTISYPPFGDIEASGLSMDELRDNITRMLKKYLVNPKVGITVTSTKSQKVLVLGEVKSPGVFQMEIPITALEAVTNAGGFTLDAESTTVLVIRGDFKNPTLLTLNLKAVFTGTDLKGNIVLKKGDILYVPARRIVNAGRFFQDLSDIISPIVEFERGIILTPSVDDAINGTAPNTVIP